MHMHIYTFDRLYHDPLRMQDNFCFGRIVMSLPRYLRVEYCGIVFYLGFLIFRAHIHEILAD